MSWLFLYIIPSLPFLTLSCHSTCDVTAKWSRNDHNITTSYRSTGQLTFLVLVLLIGVFGILSNPHYVL